MNFLFRAIQLWLMLLCIAAAPTPAVAQTQPALVEPIIGQAGKDVVWVPTPSFLVDIMLDMAQVTPQDYVIDLGSGDGRNVIAAAKRGARAMGVEYDANLVALSKHAAAMEGVADKATFVQGDMYEADISQATVLALYLLAENLRQLTPKFLDLKPGTRIVINTFGIQGWSADATDKGPGECTEWCSARLYIVPAKVAGTWHLPQGELTLTQSFQMVSGTLKNGEGSVPLANGRLRGNQITFALGGIDYTGRIEGDIMVGNAQDGSTAGWRATRARQSAGDDSDR